MAISSAIPAVQDLGAKSHLDALLATVGPVQGLRVLDLGCGEGQLSRALAKLGAEVTGYDPFIAETEPAACGAGSFRLAKATADAIPEPDHSADLVLFVFRCTTCLAPSSRERSPRRGGCCGHWAACTWPNLCRKARINTLWSCSTMKRRYAKRRPTRYRVLPGHVSPSTKFRPTPMCGAIQISARSRSA